MRVINKNITCPKFYLLSYNRPIASQYDTSICSHFLHFWRRISKARKYKSFFIEIQTVWVQNELSTPYGYCVIVFESRHTNRQIEKDHACIIENGLCILKILCIIKEKYFPFHFSSSKIFLYNKRERDLTSKSVHARSSPWQHQHLPKYE